MLGIIVVVVVASSHLVLLLSSSISHAHFCAFHLFLTWMMLFFLFVALTKHGSNQCCNAHTLSLSLSCKKMHLHVNLWLISVFALNHIAVKLSNEFQRITIQSECLWEMHKGKFWLQTQQLRWRETYDHSFARISCSRDERKKRHRNR